MYVVTQTLSFYQTTQHCTRALFKIEKRIPRKFKTSLFHCLSAIMHDILFVCWNPGSLFETASKWIINQLFLGKWQNNGLMRSFLLRGKPSNPKLLNLKNCLTWKKEQNKLDHCKFWMQDTVLCSLRFSSKLNFVAHWQNHFRI